MKPLSNGNKAREKPPDSGGGASPIGVKKKCFILKVVLFIMGTTDA
jgi:hypothetical protein